MYVCHAPKKSSAESTCACMDTCCKQSPKSMDLINQLCTDITLLTPTSKLSVAFSPKMALWLHTFSRLFCLNTNIICIKPCGASRQTRHCGTILILFGPFWSWNNMCIQQCGASRPKLHSVTFWHIFLPFGLDAITYVKQILPNDAVCHFFDLQAALYDAVQTAGTCTAFWWLKDIKKELYLVCLSGKSHEFVHSNSCCLSTLKSNHARPVWLENTCDYWQKYDEINYVWLVCLRGWMHLLTKICKTQYSLPM
jgi:hypothetical protein